MNPMELIEDLARRVAELENRPSRENLPAFIQETAKKYPGIVSVHHSFGTDHSGEPAVFLSVVVTKANPDNFRQERDFTRQVAMYLADVPKHIGILAYSELHTASEVAGAKVAS